MTSTPSPQNIRLTITVTPEVHEVYQRLADATSSSLGRTMGEWLESTIEGAEFMAGKMEEAREAPKRVIREIHAYAMGVADETGALVERMREKGREERASLRRARIADRRPPSGNTGGKVHQTPKNKPSSSGSV